MRGLPWSAVIATGHNITNPVKNSLQTLVTCFALCVPTIWANEYFNDGASCRLRNSVAYAYMRPQNAPKWYRKLKLPGGESADAAGLLEILHRSLAADGCLDPGCKSSGMNIWGRRLKVLDNVDTCASPL